MFKIYDIKAHKFYLRIVLFLRQFIALILFSFSFYLEGQVTYFREFTTQNGLPSDCIYDLATDYYGLIYIGTDQGVYSFNGVDFKQFVLKDAISSSITSISFTDKNVMWCRNFSDQVFYSKGNVLQPNKQVSTFLKDEILVDLRALNDHVYILSFEAVYIIHTDSGRLIKRIAIKHAEGISVQGDQILITNVEGKCFWLQGTKIIGSKQLLSGRYRSAGSYKSSFIIEKTKVPGLAYESNGQTIRKLGAIHKFSQGLYINSCHVINGKTFLSTNRGTFFTQKDVWKQLANGQNHTDLVLDFQGGIWISTIDNGLIYVSSLDIADFFTAQRGQSFRQVIPAPSGYFVSTNNGFVFEVDLTGKLVKTYDTKSGRDIEFIHFDPVSNRLYTSVGFFNYRDHQTFFPFYYGKGISIDAKGNLYFGIHSLSGMILSDSKQEIFLPNRKKLHSGGVDFQVIREKRTRCVHMINDILVIGYVDKLIAYFSHKQAEIKSKKGESIHAVSLAHDRHGRLWVATVQDGVYVFENGKEIKHFSVHSGLSHGQCKRLKIFGKHVYVITINGLDRLDAETFDVRSFTDDYSLQNTLILDVNELQGCLLLVTKNKVIKVPFQEEKSLVLPRILFESIKTRGGEQLRVNHTSNVLNEHSFEISWEYLAFREGVKTPLFYRLKGLEQKWRKLSPTVGSVTYNGLPHGTYCFELRSGVKNAHIFSVPIQILKPFWYAWWFILLEIVVAVLIIILTIRLTVWYVRKKQRIREQLIISQLTAIRSQMNPHFLYNVLNSLQGLIYTNKVNEAGNYVSMFSDHLRHTLDMSDKQVLTVKEEIESLDIYLRLEKLRFGDDFQYEIKKESTVNELWKIPTMILQPFVENAVKHGLLNKKGIKIVQIYFSANSSEMLQISIRDNGIGREKSLLINQKRKDKPKSFATGAIVNRIELLNQHLRRKIRIEILDLSEMGVAIGTEVLIQIPIDLEIYESINR